MRVLVLFSLLCGAGTLTNEQPNAKDLIQKFQQEEIWDEYDPLMLQRLQNYLSAAQKSRDPNVLRFLVDHHLDFEITRWDRMPSVKEMYPVVGLLVDLGLKQVPFLFDRIKEMDPKDASPQAEKKRKLLVLCLREIYANGGVGHSMASERIRLEIGKTQGRERESLMKCLPKREEEPSTAATPRP